MSSRARARTADEGPCPADVDDEEAIADPVDEERREESGVDRIQKFRIPVGDHNDSNISSFARLVYRPPNLTWPPAAGPVSDLIYPIISYDRDRSADPKRETKPVFSQSSRTEVPGNGF